MYRDLEYIKIIFENCNTVKIYPENIVYVSFRDIYKTIFISSGNDSESICCKEFEIKFKKEALNMKTYFETENNSSETFEKHLSVYEDITGIFVVRKNKEETILVLYNEENGINTLQKLSYSKNHVVISICE